MADERKTEVQEEDTGNGADVDAGASASAGTAASSAPSRKRRKQDTEPTSPVERLEIFQSAFNDLQKAGIPSQALRSKDGQTLMYKIAGRLCPLCKQPRPLWHFIGNICRECQP